MPCIHLLAHYRERFDHREGQFPVAEDVASQAFWRSVRARVLTHQGKLDEAVELAREAVDILTTTDILARRAEALIDLAEILDTAGRGDEARNALDDAIALLEERNQPFKVEIVNDLDPSEGPTVSFYRHGTFDLMFREYYNRGIDPWELENRAPARRGRSPASTS
jgi:tetratricopeptide (TPR) repeat protein